MMKIESRISGFTRAAHLCRRHASAVLWVTMAALFPTACSDDTKQPTPQTDGHTAVIYLNFKTGGASRPTAETRAPMTRAAVDEVAINTVDVLSFKADPADPTNIKKGTFFYRAQGTYDAGAQTVRVRLLGTSEHQTLVVLANVREQVNALGAALGEQKEAVMNRLTFNAGADAAPDFTNGIPMWGELPDQAVGETFSPLGSPKVVTMIRSAAKFTLINPHESDPKGFFYYYTDLRLYNYRTKGRIAPDNYNTTDKKVNTPTVPAGARQGRGTFVALNSGMTIYHGNQKSFYLCEVDNRNRPSGGNALDDLCLIMHVKYHNSPGPTKPNFHGYYRLDFKDYGSGVPMDILRNHDYQIKVESVDGLPAPTPEQAFSGNHTLKCRIVPWNKVNEDVHVEGNKRLTVDKRKVEIPLAEMATGGKLTITTENTNGWSISDATPGITFSKSTATADGTETITIRTVPRKGSFKLKAGNAEMEIKVKRGAVPLEYVAEYNLAGGSQYGSKPNVSSLVTPAHTDPDLRWATSHTSNQSGYYNWYVCKGIPKSDYNPDSKNLFSDPFFITGAGKGYHLPSLWELIGVFSYSGGKIFYGSPINTPNINEAIEFGDVKNTFASDYYTPFANVCYALRFKQGTGNPNDSFSSISDFPLAPDNSMLCAYRYTRTGGFSYGFNSGIKVDCVYLGSKFTGTVNDISNEAWWNTRTSETTTRFFPAHGWIEFARASDSGRLKNPGLDGRYWSGTEKDGYAWGALIVSNSAYVNWGSKYNGLPVRLFASE